MQLSLSHSESDGSSETCSNDPAGSSPAVDGSGTADHCRQHSVWASHACEKW